MWVQVGHNALGAGQVIDQGASLVDKALESGAFFEGECRLAESGPLILHRATTRDWLPLQVRGGFAPPCRLGYMVDMFMQAGMSLGCRRGCMA